MGKARVKQKFPLSATLTVLAVATFLSSLLGVFPRDWVEKIFALSVFPTISRISGVVADAVPFSWLDVAILALVVAIFYSYRRRRWGIAVGVIAGAYLWFFWTWGLNYHRPPLESRLHLQPNLVNPEQFDSFSLMAATELNRLHPQVQQMEKTMIDSVAANRVGRVVSKIDGSDWRAASRVKHSLIAQGWFRIAGVEGMFNPFGQEPLVTRGLLNIELPFCVSHELAHVRGIANEGDANLIAFFATIASEEPIFRYSGWLSVWGYIRTPELDAMLDPGPVADLKAIALRMRSQQVRWASNLQSTVLDLHLKANDVKEGTESYSRFVAQAIASKDQWDDYR